MRRSYGTPREYILTLKSAFTPSLDPSCEKVANSHITKLSLTNISSGFQTGMDSWNTLPYSCCADASYLVLDAYSSHIVECQNTYHAMYKYSSTYVFSSKYVSARVTLY